MKGQDTLRLEGGDDTVLPAAGSTQYLCVRTTGASSDIPLQAPTVMSTIYD
ncbi:MAG: hypothetical protein ACREDR_29925 [Blastocatellia bacterium]